MSILRERARHWAFGRYPVRVRGRRDDIVGRSSDRTGEPRWHFAICALAGGVGLILSTLFPSNVFAAIVALSVATAGILSSFPLSWTMPTAMLAGSAAAAGIALINSIGGLAGFVSPYLVGWIGDLTHRLDVGLYVIAFYLFLGALLVVVVVPVNLADAIARKNGSDGRQDRLDARRTGR